MSVMTKGGGYAAIRGCEMIPGIAKEEISQADNITGRLGGRSRSARFGPAVHVTAGYICPRLK